MHRGAAMPCPPTPRRSLRRHTNIYMPGPWCGRNRGGRGIDVCVPSHWVPGVAGGSPLSSPSPAAAGRGRPNWAGPERTHQKTHSFTGRDHFGSSASVATRPATLSPTRHYPKVVTPSMRTLCGEEGSFVRRRSIPDQQECDGINRDAR